MSVSPSGGVVKVIGVGVAILVLWSTSGIYRISAIYSSFDATSYQESNADKIKVIWAGCVVVLMGGECGI